MSVDEVLARALRRSEEAQSVDHEERFQLRLRRVSEELGDGGDVRKREEKLYHVFPVEGRWFEKLIEKDGRELNARESAREAARQRRFAESIRQGRASDPSGKTVTFDKQLVEKYVWEMRAPKTVEGRDCYVLTFRPRSKDLPVRNRMDYALNKAEGEIWIDVQSYEVARVEFELKEKVKLWWGILGSITRAEGTVERRPAGDGVWLPHRFEMYLNGRILFSSLHQRQEVHWTDVQPAVRGRTDP